MEIGKGETAVPTLEYDELVFRFPKIEKNASFSINFQRTLRIPDSEATYGLPPGLGAFPLRHAEDYPKTLSASTLSRGGIILPIWQAEALWLDFTSRGPTFGTDFPVAVKVAAGKINAVTGEALQGGLSASPQDYMVSPEQPWLDGFALEKGVIRQFVAMPLGDGYSVEEQLTGQSLWGGLQITVTPLKASVWQFYLQKMKERWSLNQNMECSMSASDYEASSMGLGAGGRMRQVIHPDPFDIDDWDLAATERVFVSLVHGKDWKAVTGEAAPNHPPSAQDYTRANLPWFEHYGRDQGALPGGALLKRVKSVGALFSEKTGAALPNSEDVTPGPIHKLGPGANKPREVR